jgi:hypothetical protein
MRIIDGANPITVWREKRGFTLAQLASAVGLPDGDLARIESGGVVDKIAGALDVRQGILALVKVSS